MVSHSFLLSSPKSLGNQLITLTRKVSKVKDCGSVCGPDGSLENGGQDIEWGSSGPPALEAQVKNWVPDR